MNKLLKNSGKKSRKRLKKKAKKVLDKEEDI